MHQAQHWIGVANLIIGGTNLGMTLLELRIGGGRFPFFGTACAIVGIGFGLIFA